MKQFAGLFISFILGVLIIGGVLLNAELHHRTQEREHEEFLAMFHDDTQTEIVEFSNEYFVFYTNGDFNLGPASLQAMERGSSASAPEIVGFGNDPVSVTIGNADRYYKDLCMSQQKAGIYPCVVTFAWVDGQWTVLE